MVSAELTTIGIFIQFGHPWPNVAHGFIHYGFHVKYVGTQVYPMWSSYVGISYKPQSESLPSDVWANSENASYEPLSLALESFAPCICQALASRIPNKLLVAFDSKTKCDRSLWNWFMAAQFRFCAVLKGRALPPLLSLSHCHMPTLSMVGICIWLSYSLVIGFEK